MDLKAKSVVLFEGDSITDAGRNRQDYQSLAGYPHLIDTALKALYPESGILSVNRAVSGDTTENLLARLNKSLAEVRPDAVSLLIGINDTWRKFDSNREVPLAEFTDHYRAILDMISAAGCKILLLEPFLIPADAKKAGFRPDLDPKIQAVRQLSAEFQTGYIPLDGIFAEAVAERGDAAFYAEDGIHPTLFGHALIAREWLKRVRIV